MNWHPLQKNKHSSMKMKIRILDQNYLAHRKAMKPSKMKEEIIINK